MQLATNTHHDFYDFYAHTLTSPPSFYPFFLATTITITITITNRITYRQHCDR
jgi:hypothetical protein